MGGGAERIFLKSWEVHQIEEMVYGMRKAASGWEDDYARRLVKDGFRRGRAAPTIFYHPKTQVRVVVHGDDFTFAGTEPELKKIRAKTMKPEEINQEEDTERLDVPETNKFRSLAATLHYTSSDRSDVQYAAKEVCTKMASPTPGSWKRLKKANRYLKGVETVTWKMGAWENDDEVNVDVHVDSNWASGLERKSTSGGMMMICGTVVKHWSRTQATRELSTAEAEYYAVVTGAAEGLGMQSMMADLGVTNQVRVWTDSNAVKAIASRRGLGET